MKRNEMATFHKVFLVACILCLIAGITLMILDIMGILTGVDMLEDVIDCVFWLSAGIAFWKKERLLPIVCFVLAGLNLICVFI